MRVRILALLLIVAGAAFSYARNARTSDSRYSGPGVRGTVESLNGHYFTMDANDVKMQVYVDGNTRFKVGNFFVPASYVAKDAEVAVSGTSDRVGVMNGQFIVIIPSSTTLSGTIKEFKSGQFVLEPENGGDAKPVRVRLAKFTKCYSGKAPGDEGKKVELSRLKDGAKVDVTPLTNSPDAVDAYEINIR